jgi:hypothetical protein
MADRDQAGRFLPGNRIWELSPPGPGRPPTFKTQKALWEAAVAYFEWVDGNPLHEAKAFSYEGKITVAELPKLRAMTINGLCLSLGVSTETWRGWKTEGHELFREDLLPMIERIEAVIYEQKFTGAAAELLNPSIIARELGRAEKKQLGNDPENPLPEPQVTFFALPDNGRD